MRDITTRGLAARSGESTLHLEPAGPGSGIIRRPDGSFTVTSSNAKGCHAKASVDTAGASFVFVDYQIGMSKGGSGLLAIRSEKRTTLAQASMIPGDENRGRLIAAASGKSAEVVLCAYTDETVFDVSLIDAQKVCTHESKVALSWVRWLRWVLLPTPDAAPSFQIIPCAENSTPDGLSATGP